MPSPPCPPSLPLPLPTGVLPGYETSVALDGTHAGVTAATLCAADSWRGPAVYDASLTKAECTGCVQYSGTDPTAPLGATSVDACLATPGNYYVGSGVFGQCAANTYNVGYNKETSCELCGTNQVALAGSESSGACYTPAGYGALFVSPGVLRADPCPANTYGRAQNTYGIVEVECTKCPEHTYANTTGHTSIDDCLTVRGYGYEDGAVNQCDFGTYSVGGDVSACTACAPGYNTSFASGQIEAEGVGGATMGAYLASQCVVGAGVFYTNGNNANGGLSPCPRNTYNAKLSYGVCDDCPGNKATMILSGATLASDCDACKPGSAGADCTSCISGKYAPGYVLGGGSCTDCPKPSGFTGNMVSRVNTSTPEDCVPEFPSNGGSPSKYTFDYFAGLGGLGTDASSSGTTQALCQTACGANCIFFTFANTTDGATCQIFAATTTPDATNTKIAAGVPPTPLLLLEVKPQIYVSYPVDATLAGAIGTTISSEVNFATAKAACDADASCVGLAATAADNTHWRTFKGSLYEGTVTKIKAYGPSINSWVA